jgi:uncharacterized protein (TIGR01777 family)
MAGKVVIPGGSGQVGTVLARAFHAAGDDVVVLSRRPTAAPWRTVVWDARTLGRWTAELEGAGVVINLAGRSVNCRYTPANRLEILRSRVDSTRVLGGAIDAAKQPPRLWLQASTATIYAHRYDAPNDEHGVIGGSEPDAPASWHFSIEVARAWEAAVDEAAAPFTRKVKMRSAMIMSPDRGGIFATLLALVRFGLGGRVASGRQFISWIHDADFVAAVEWLIAHESATGIYNIASPNPLPQVDFMRDLRRAWGRRIGLPATRWMVELGTLILRTETELILKSRRVVPRRLLDEGFRFRFSSWPPAALDLCSRYRAPSLP